MSEEGTADHAGDDVDWWPATGPESTRDRFRRILGTGLNTERTVFFSDAVMAIAMTLLVLEIRIPDVAPSRFAAALADDFFTFYAFALGFVLIGTSWLAHHRKFKLIARYDGGLQLTNLLFLFFIALLPVATEALSLYPQTISVVLYAVIIAGCWLSQMGIWIHAHRAHLFLPVVDDDLYRYVRANQVPTWAIFLLSIPVALFVDSTLAMFTWIAIAPAQVLVGRLGVRRLDRRRAAARPDGATAVSRSRG